ncbi:MAG: hypothetical protein EPO11_01020, partial [Gammaproteobacteria bacterium]
MAKGRPASLLTLLIFLTGLAILGQVSFIAANYLANGLIDTLTSSSIFAITWYYPAILLPIIQVIVIQLVLYVLLIAILWYLTQAIGNLFFLRQSSLRLLGIFLWMMAAIDIFAVNSYRFPDSLFSQFIRLPDAALIIIIAISSTLLLIAILLAGVRLIRHRMILLGISAIL